MNLIIFALLFLGLAVFSEWMIERRQQREEDERARRGERSLKEDE